MGRLERWALPLLVVLASFAAFWPALDHPFLNWDDRLHLVENDRYRGFSGAHLRWMFADVRTGNYQPLTWLSHAVDHRLWGTNPRGHHLTNLLIHAGAAGLFYLVLLCLLGPPTGATRWAAAIGAVCFGLHPLRVESVAWITERRDLLSGFLLLAAVLAYLRRHQAEGRARSAWLLLSLLAYAASLLSKAWGVSLVVPLLLLDGVPLRRWGREPTGRLLAEKLPYLLIALPVALAARHAQQTAGAMVDWQVHPLGARLMQAMYGLAFYPRKSLWPSGLSPLYELERPLDPGALPYVASAAGVVLVTALLVALARRWPAGLAAWLAYAALVSPVLGLFQSGPQKVADRYSYVACLPLAALLAAGLALAGRRLEGGRLRGAGLLLLLGLGLPLGIASWRQTGVWKDSLSLWTQATRVEPGSYYAWSSLGDAALEAGQTDRAIACYRRSLEIRDDPANVRVRFNLGTIHARRGAYLRAAEQFARVLELQPASGRARAALIECARRAPAADRPRIIELIRRMPR